MTIIGGGVVGLAIAAELSTEFSPLCILERNPKFGQETSSRNSEVIHAGIYYPHHSLKARLCVEGKHIIYQICSEHDIPHKRIGKIITATRREELDELEHLYRHGLRNGTELTLLTAEDVQALDPNIASVGGILSPSSGIVSAHGLIDFFCHKARASGADLLTRCKVVGLVKRGGEFAITVRESGMSEPSGHKQNDRSRLFALGSQLSTFSSRYVINAAGLESDTVAGLAGIDVDKAGYRLHWAKGSYFAVTGEKRKGVSHLVYPIPPRESLGIHAVVDLGGGLKFGPDVEYLTERTLDYTVDESKRPSFAEAVKRIVPCIGPEDLSPDMSGIRSKLQAKGEPPQDFIIREESDKGLPGLVNLIGIDSPGLTASPAIAKYVHTLLAFHS